MILVVVAVVLDWILGDPYFFPHPVKLMGIIINIEEKLLRLIFKSSSGLRLAGLIMVIINVCLAIFPMYFLLARTEGTINTVITVITYYFCISARMLHYEAIKVRKALNTSLQAARNQLRFIVGRDTEPLDEEEIVKATVETISENTSDGIIAPLFYILLFGPVGGLTYKFINTMDSMIGYKNVKYRNLGRYAALLDDVVNYIPARITGLLMCLAALRPSIIERGLSIMMRDRRNHSSPNSGYPEAAIAGILGIQLGGSHYYGGNLVVKPVIGDNTRNATASDIVATIYIMYKTEIIFLVISALTMGMIGV